jgi:hypothetical protein
MTRTVFISKDGNLRYNRLYSGRYKGKKWHQGEFWCHFPSEESWLQQPPPSEVFSFSFWPENQADKGCRGFIHVVLLVSFLHTV